VELHGQLTLYASGTIVDMSTGKPFYSKNVIAGGDLSLGMLGPLP